MKDRIAAAAFKPEGANNIHTGHSYSEIIVRMVKEEGIELPIRGEYGFTTEKGKFVDCTIAADIAVKSGQVKKLIHPPDLSPHDINFPEN
jgi:hypothetical protein